MLLDAGYSQITDAEALFVMNNLARFERTISPQGFEKWATEMARLTPKKLIYYSAYLDTSKMEIRTDRDFAMRQQKEYDWRQQIRGHTLGHDRVPDSLRVLTSEMHALGETFVRKVMKKYSVWDPQTDSEMIEFDMLCDMIAVFKYNMTAADRSELKWYLFNTKAIQDSLKDHRLVKNKIYIDVDVLTERLRDAYRRLGFEHHQTDLKNNGESFEQLAQLIVESKMADVFDLLESYEENYSYTKGMIGERELRRLLRDHFRMSD